VAIHDEVVRFGTVTRVNSSALHVRARARYGSHLHDCLVDWDGPGSNGGAGYRVTCRRV
jgi:hypothetical protein